MTKKRTISIYQTTYGSDPISMGETSLSYTEGVSDFARNICTSFSDNRGELNPLYSTFMLLYDPNTDRYVLTHIQGQEWVFENGARKYPFRGAYEISRADYSNLYLSNIVDSLPRINPESKSLGKISAETEIPNALPDSSFEAKILALNIQYALSHGKYLYVNLNVNINRDDMRENKIFQSKHFRTLLQAIDCLPAEYKQYATFSFLADDNYIRYVEKCAVNIILPTSQINPSSDNSVIMTWDEAVSRPSIKESPVLPSIPHPESALPPFAEVLKYINHIPVVEKKVKGGDYYKLSDEDWVDWINGGHVLSSLVVRDRNTYEYLLQVFERINQLIEQGQRNLPKEFAKSVLTKDFFLHQNEYQEDDISYWERQLSGFGIWTKELSLEIWNMWTGIQKDSVASLIEFERRNNLGEEFVANFQCNKGLGKLPKKADNWAQTLIYTVIKEKYDLSHAEKLPEICNALLQDKTLKNYVLDFEKYISLDSLRSWAQDYCAYIDSLGSTEQLRYVKESKVIIWAVCRYLRRNNDDGGDKLKKKCEAILYPNRKRNIHLSCAFFMGVLIGVAVTLFSTWLKDKYCQKPDLELASVVADDDEAKADTMLFYYYEISSIPQLSKLYFSEQDTIGIIKFGSDTIDLDSISDVEKIYAKLRCTTDSISSLKCVFRINKTDTNGNTISRKDTCEIGKDSTLFMILRDLPQGSRLDYIINPSVENGKLLDIPNSSIYQMKAENLPNGDCPLTYYFWLIQYLESSSVKDKPEKIIVSY